MGGMSREGRAKVMRRRWFVALIFVAHATGGLDATRAQALGGGPWWSQVVVPQARSYAPGRSTVLQIVGVTAGVVIRDATATTMMEVRLRNPGTSRQEAELLLPVPDGVIVRGFTFEGNGAEPSARLLPRDEARRAYDRIVSQARDPALLEFVGFNLIRSSVFPVEPGGTQAVRVTYEHLLKAYGDRVDYVLPRSESVEYTIPWKIAVKISSTTSIAAVYSPSHPVRTSRPKASEAAIEASGTEPGSFRLSFLRERPDVSASLFAYPDPKIGGGYFLLLAGLPAQSSKTDSVGLRREV